MVTGAFGIILVLSRQGFEAESIIDLKGLNERSPWLALMMLLLMMSMAGIPFLVGFYAKLAVPSGGYSGGFCLAGDSRRDNVGYRCILLSSRGQVHLL